MLEGLLVGTFVTMAAAYAVWALLPAGLRLSLARRIGAWTRGPGRPAWLGRAASGLERAAQAAVGSCCDCSANPGSKGSAEERPKH